MDEVGRGRVAGPAESMTAAAAILYTVLVPGVLTILIPWLIVDRHAAFPAGVPWASRLGWLAVIGGGLVVIRCVRDFITVGRGTPAPSAPPQALVATGPYRWSRNPMYAGMLAMILGEALVSWSLPLLLHALGMWTAMQAFLLAYEEPSLRRRFGPAYDEYRRLVPRWIGLRARE
jgi:protein-S-isoprenylcysteine O-methyltransferase Ste14